MSYSAKETWYFDAPGPANTEDAALCAVKRASELGIKTIVVASSSGATALKFLDATEGTDLSLVVVTHAFGYKIPGKWDFSEETAEFLRSRGVTIVTGTHALSGLERALSKSPKVGGGSRTEAIAEAFRKTVAVGLKVAVECVLISADQGVLDGNDEVIAVGGTASGADTVCVIRPSNTASFFDLQVREIAAMPRNR